MGFLIFFESWLKGGELVESGRNEGSGRSVIKEWKVNAIIWIRKERRRREEASSRLELSEVFNLSKQRQVGLSISTCPCLLSKIGRRLDKIDESLLIVVVEYGAEFEL